MNFAFLVVGGVRVRYARRITLCLLASLLVGVAAQARDYHFDGSISEEVLHNYLSRSMTTMYLLTGHGDFDDNLRMLTNCGVKFAGRAVFNWGREQGGEGALPQKFAQARAAAAKVHAADPDLILQACVFEIVSRDVEKLAVPAWVFQEFGQPVEVRNFRYDDMIYPNGRGNNQWGPDASVPDVSRPETERFFFYLAASYIDLGCEGIHFGQVELMNHNDPGSAHWADTLDHVRRYAHQHARRHLVLCDAHVPGGGLVRDGKLLLDFHAFPLRIEEISDQPQQARLRMGYTDAFYGRSRGGLTPSGWKCEHLPYLVEFDNYGHSRHPGQAGMGPFWVWGWDEITWFAQQPGNGRNDWLRYAWQWIHDHDPAGNLEMPGFRCLSGATNGKTWYDVNRPSAATPNGYGQEDTIRAIWAADSGTGRPGGE